MKYKTVATHNGDFHADEVVAISVLRKYNSDLTVRRTRDPSVYSKADIRVDVGMRYDPSTHDFDHHQKGGAGKRDNGVPYASAGLIWKHFGYLFCDPESSNIVDETFIQPVDAIDTGYQHPVRAIYSFDSAIKSFNSKIFDRDAFEAAINFSLTILNNEISHAHEQVSDNMTLRSMNTNGLPYLVLNEEISWQPVVVNETEKLYVVYPSGDGKYRLKCVPTEVGGFNPRKPLPEAWTGRSQSELERMTGIRGFEFCHDQRFVASFDTLEGAVEAAKIASL